jgi:hypothetical protein
MSTAAYGTDPPGGCRATRLPLKGAEIGAKTQTQQQQIRCEGSRYPQRPQRFAALPDSAGNARRHQ